MSKGRISSAHPYIKSPFSKAFNAFPKDFFGDEGVKLVKKSSEGNMWNKVNLSSEILNNCNNSFEKQPPRPVIPKDTKSYRVLNRKYVKSRTSESDLNGSKIVKQSSWPRNFISIESLKMKENSSIKESRNKFVSNNMLLHPTYWTNPNSSFSKLNSSIVKPVRPIIKARKIQNYLKNPHDTL